jgi:hypothetical protein
MRPEGLNSVNLPLSNTNEHQRTALLFMEFYYVFIYLCSLFKDPVFLGAVRYNPEGRGFDSRWRHWNILLT